MAGSKRWPRKGEPSASHPFFSISWTFYEQKIERLTVVTRPTRPGAERASALPPPEEAPPGLRADPSSRLCPHSAPQADSAPVLPPSEAPPSLWLRGCPSHEQCV